MLNGRIGRTGSFIQSVELNYRHLYPILNLDCYKNYGNTAIFLIRYYMENALDINKEIKMLFEKYNKELAAHLNEIEIKHDGVVRRIPQYAMTIAVGIVSLRRLG